jgi:predicted SAM-dependent methyltransferase
MIEKIRLNVGCGNKLLPGYINIDIRKTNEEVVVADIRNLPYGPNSVDEIYANDVLEHVSFRETQEVLNHWFDILISGGKLFIQSPHFKSLVDFAAKARTTVEKQMAIARFFGGQDYPENTHMTAIDENILADQLRVAGFTTPMAYEAGNFGNRTNIRITIFK